MARSTKKRGAKDSALSLDRLKLGPIVVVISAEPVLAERTVERLRRAAVANNPTTEVVKLDASSYQPGHLAVATSPSLFAQSRLVVAENAEKMTDAFLAETLDYVAHPQPEIALIICHAGGNRGKRLLDAVEKAGFQVGKQEKVKYDDDKARLVRVDVAGARREITDGAVAALVDALGSDLRELLSATAQVLEDSTGTIDEADVRATYAGRNEVTPFEVADAAIAGQTGRALSLARHAFATRVSPVPIVAALASKLRQLALVQVGGKLTRSEDNMASWQKDRARRELRHWTGDGLARAILATAQADAQVKGASRDPEYALERAIVVIGQARGRTR